MAKVSRKGWDRWSVGGLMTPSPHEYVLLFGPSGRQFRAVDLVDFLCHGTHRKRGFSTPSPNLELLSPIALQAPSLLDFVLSVLIHAASPVFRALTTRKTVERLAPVALQTSDQDMPLSSIEAITAWRSVSAFRPL